MALSAPPLWTAGTSQGVFARRLVLLCGPDRAHGNVKEPDGLDLARGAESGKADAMSDEPTHPTRRRRRRRFWFALVVLAVTVAAPATAVWLAGPSGEAPAVPTFRHSLDDERVPAFRHALVVVFENKERGEVVGNPAAPTFAALARQYATISAYEAVAHPSLPNYLALVSGSTQGIHSDCTSCLVRATNLADILQRAGLSWKTYAEGLPRPGFTGASAGLYAKKHDPFLYFGDIAHDPSRRARVVPLGQLRRDLAAGRLPDFALVIPNLCHDMHDCPVASGDQWLRRTIVPLLREPALARSVVFVVFDEGATDTGGGGQVAALALGPLVRPGSHSKRQTNHYGLLRTLEDAWGLSPLGHSAEARPITGIWQRDARRPSRGRVASFIFPVGAQGE